MTIPAVRQHGSIVITAYGPAGPGSYAEGVTIVTLVTRGRQGLTSLPPLPPTTAPSEYARQLYLVSDASEAAAPTDTVTYIINGSGDEAATVYLEYFDADGSSIYTQSVTVKPRCLAIRTASDAINGIG